MNVADEGRRRHTERGGTREESRVGKNYPEIDGALRSFIERQKMFFVASAPSGAAGHVNVSPKGLDSFRVLGPRRVGYLDYNGSGVETIAHVRESGRLTIMFCAFEGKPNIVRLYGTGRIVESGADGYDDLLAAFGLGASSARVRSIIVLDVERITDSCGFGVPLFSFVGDREQLAAWAERKTPGEIRAYQREKNAVSVDGLPGLPSVCGEGKCWARGGAHRIFPRDSLADSLIPGVLRACEGWHGWGWRRNR